MFSSFGFFMLLAFTGAYFVFRSEYKRKEAQGIIHAFPLRPQRIHPLIWTLLGFITGAKLVYWWLNRSVYIGIPQDFIFSARGNLAAGILTGLAAGLITSRKPSSPPATRLPNPSSPPAIYLTHPYQLMDTLLLYCGLFGFAGAITFARFEDPANFGHLPAYNGLNYYGALIAGALTYLYINKRHGIRPAIAADIGSPGMMLAYAIGRLGCHIAGDGDWGMINRHPTPAWLPQWLWASYYPHNSIHQGVYIPGCTGSSCTILQAPVYPTPLYETIICACLFFLLWSLRRTIKKPGHLFALFAILNGSERFLIEFIRINPRYSIGPWELSQAQILALGWIITGGIVLFLTLKSNK